jgi:hypothetical protein
MCRNPLTSLQIVSVDCHCLQLPNTTPYPGPHSVLVLDNCALHHSEEIYKVVEEFGTSRKNPPKRNTDRNWLCCSVLEQAVN